MLRILFVENKNPFYEHFYILQHIFYILVLIFSILTLLLAIKRLIRDTNEKRLFDALTGAYNRLGLQHFIEFDLPKLNTFSLIMLDIDFFKSVNSQYGHPIGDSVIKILVYLIKTNMNSEDSKVIRLGGEEFMVILPSLNQIKLMKKAEYLREVIENYDFSEIAEGLVVTVSMGVGEYDATIDFQDIYTDIDRKLAEAKRNGRNQIVSVINS
nr:GGDEF domain-containing protein [Acinetobacter nectaris]